MVSFRPYLKYKVTQDDIDRGKSPGGGNVIGITTETVTYGHAGVSTTFDFNETSNYIQVPTSIIGINKVWKFDGQNFVIVHKHVQSGIPDVPE